jgi:hypothetical protein
MRVTCPNCGQRHDVPHRAVLAEAARLAAHQTQDVFPPAISMRAADRNRAEDEAAMQARRMAILWRINDHCG